jgi:hypothetical protein
MSVYVVDSNFFIQAHRVTYPLDIAFSFWKKVKQLGEEGKIISIDKVKIEIYSNNDDLKEWCQANLPADFFKDSSQIMASYAEVSTWAISRSAHYLPNALNEFLDADEADAFIVAFALADSNNRIIVTQEVSEPNRRNKIKIPDACNALDAQFVNTMSMFRQLGETF